MTDKNMPIIPSGPQQGGLVPPGPPPLIGGGTGIAKAAGYAGLGRRVLAAVIDMAVLGMVMALIGWVLNHQPEVLQHRWTGDDARVFDRVPPPSLQTAWLVAWAYFAYFAVMESSRWQASLGKRALGLFVAREDGRRLSFSQAAARLAGAGLSAIPFGFPVAFFTRRRQALHDMMSGTVVLRCNADFFADPPYEHTRF